MREIHGATQAVVGGDPDAVFAVVTDVGRLPQWNAAIEQVLAGPGQLGPGAEWAVRMRPHRYVSWGSVSTVTALDRRARRFAYRTVNADGNPSYSLWEWTVAGDGASTTVAVRWEVHLRTWDRRLLAGPIRRRELDREVAASLQALARLAVAAPAEPK